MTELKNTFDEGCKILDEILRRNNIQHLVGKNTNLYFGIVGLSEIQILDILKS